jgi:phosphatidate cytidylyltransferase
MLAQRLITAAVGIPIIVALILIGGTVYTVAAAVFLGLAALEFVAAVNPENGNDHPRLQTIPRPLWQPTLAGAVAAAGVVLLVAGADAGYNELTGALVLAVAASFIFLLPAGDPERGLPAWVTIIGAVVYIGFLGAHLVLLRALDDDGHWVLLAVLATWGTDTFAYFVGRTMGQRKLAPRISPGKTLEGTAAAIGGGLIVVALLNWPLDLPMNTGQALLLGLMLPAVAVVGDLAESFIKRGAGIKDTSGLVPGHGGFLDRLDSILFTVPLVYYFAIWVVL